MRFALISLWKYKRTYGSLCIQLVISFSLVILGMSIYNQTYKNINTLKKEFPSNCVNLIFDNREAADKAIQENQLPGKLYQWEYGNKIRLQQEDATSEQVWIDLNSIQKGFFPVQQGRSLQAEDIDKINVWPLLVGKGLLDKFPLNKEITVPVAQRDGRTIQQKVIAVGVLEEKRVILPYGNIQELSLYSSNKIVVGVQPTDEKRRRSNFYIELQEGNSMPEVSGLRSQENMDDVIKGILIGKQDLIIACAIIAGLLLLLTCLGMLGSMLSISLLRVKEYGIRIALGATEKMLLWMTVFETLFLCVSSWIIAIICIFPLMSLDDMAFDMGWMTIGGSAGVTLIVALLTGILPLIQLAKMEPIRIIMGRG